MVVESYRLKSAFLEATPALSGSQRVRFGFVTWSVCLLKVQVAPGCI